LASAHFDANKFASISAASAAADIAAAAAACVSCSYWAFGLTAE
jgi:hypothetical protein